MTRPTYHLVPADAWVATDRTRPYAASTLTIDGFIHCTDGVVELLRTADRHFGDDPRPFVALTIDLDRVTAPWRIEDAAGIYPHVFGPIDQAAICAVACLVREPDGRFIGFGIASGGTSSGA